MLFSRRIIGALVGLALLIAVRDVIWGRLRDSARLGTASSSPPGGRGKAVREERREEL